MKAYQIKINNENFSLPFDNNKHCLIALAKLNFEDVRVVDVEEVEIKTGDLFRSGNTIFEKDSVYVGTVKGCYYREHKEHI